MTYMNRIHLGRAVLLGAFFCCPPAHGQQPAPACEQRSPASALVEHHAAWSFEQYRCVERLATELQRRVVALVDDPNERTLQAARDAWLTARRAYGRTEVMRFHDGPIEPLEPLLNSWPVDEAYIDYVAGRPDCGIVNDAERFPNLAAAMLVLANERGGEANICVGWHAIEFVLWGQDLSADGPGERPITDFVPGVGRNAERRCAYLRSITDLLVRHLGELRAAWAPGARYRRRFVADVDGSVRRMLVGATMLSAFELGGERTVVAYETRDQEQEHSCFSDSTWQDCVANQAGLREVVLGSELDGERGPGIVDLIRATKPDVAALLAARVDATARALAAIPQPFDQAFVGDDDGPGRTALRRAITALEQQTEALLIVGKELGHDLPLSPGG